MQCMEMFDDSIYRSYAVRKSHCIEIRQVITLDTYALLFLLSATFLLFTKFSFSNICLIPYQTSPWLGLRQKFIHHYRLCITINYEFITM